MNNYAAISSRILKACATIAAMNDSKHASLAFLSISITDENKVRIDTTVNAVMCARVDIAQDCAVSDAMLNKVDALPEFGQMIISANDVKALVKIGIECTHVFVNTPNGYMVYTNEVDYSHFKPINTDHKLPNFDKFYNDIDFNTPCVHIGVNADLAISAAQFIKNVAGKNVEMRMLTTERNKPVYYTHKDDKCNAIVCLMPVRMFNDVLIDFNNTDYKNVVTNDSMSADTAFYNAWIKLYNRKPYDDEINSFMSAFNKAQLLNKVTQDELNCITFTPALCDW